MDEFESLFMGQQMKKLCELQYEELMKKYSLRQIELEILYFLGKSSALRVAKEIVDNWNVSKAHVSKSIEHLREGGYLNVTKSQEDYRLTHLEITEKGKSLVREIARCKNNVSDILYKGVTREEKEVLLQVAVKMKTNISMELRK